MSIRYTQTSYPARVEWLNRKDPGLYISNMGIFRSHGNFIFEQVASQISCHIIQSGAGIMRIDGRECEVSAGSIAVFFPGAHIVYYDYPESPWEYVWFRLDGRQNLWALSQAGITPERPCRKIENWADINGWIESLAKKFASGAYSSVYPASSAWEFAALLCEGRSVARDGEAPDGSYLAEACRLTLENPLGGIPTVDELAERFNVNRSTLFRAFKKSFGISPKEYIENFRFEKARSLLDRTNLSVKEVAFSCGFEKQYYFSTAFRKRFGVAPSEWKRTRLRWSSQKS